jgi:hypothetical protein
MFETVRWTALAALTVAGVVSANNIVDDRACVVSAQMHMMPFYKKNETSCFQSPGPFDDAQATPTYPAVAEPVRWSVSLSDNDDATALAQFKASTIAGLKKTVPNDYPNLYTSPAPSAKGTCVDAVTGASQLANIFAEAGVTTDNPNYTPLMQQMPLLFDATTGGKIEFVSFALLDTTTAQLHVTIGGVQPISNTTFRVQIVDGTVAGTIVQQQKDDHECYHCFLWVVCCDDNWYNVPDTTAQLDDIKTGTENALASFLSTAYPVDSCLAAPTAVAEEEPNLQLAYLDAKPEAVFDFVLPQWYHVPNSTDNFARLLEEEKAILNSAPIEHLLHRNSSDPLVQHFQKEFTSIAESADSIKLSGMDVSKLDIMTSTMISDPKIAADMAKLINDSFVSVPVDDLWVQFTLMQTTNNSGTSENGIAIDTFFVYPRVKDKNNYVTSMDVVIVTAELAFATDLVDIQIKMHKLKNGTIVPVVNITHVPNNPSGADKQQIIALAEYFTAEMAVQVLTPAPARQTPSFHMAGYQLKYEALRDGRMVEIPKEYFLTTDMDLVDALPLDSKLRDSIKNFLDLVNAALSTLKAIGGFIHSSSTTTKMISGPGFSALQTYSDSMKLSGMMIDPNNPETGSPMCTSLLSAFNNTDQDLCTKRIWLMSQETGDSPGVWDNVNHAGNLTVDGVIGGHIYHLTMTPNINGSDYSKPQPHDFTWVVYTYSFDFTGGVELVTTTSSWFGGIFGSQHHDVIHMPPVWTSQDAQDMDTFLQAILMNRLCLLLKTDPSGPPCPEPKFPKPGVSLK